MANQQAFNGPSGMFNSDLHDPVFEPSPDFHFEDETHHMMSGAYDHHRDFPLYDGSMQPDFAMGGHMHHPEIGGLPHGYWQGSFQQNYAPGSMAHSSTQAEIVNNRADSVAQTFGQITPPNDDSTTSQPAQAQADSEADAVKRKERARNAANKRHAKQKKPRTGSESMGDEEGLEDRGERQAHYREKNRVAAAKCRAKKKNHNDHLEEMHRDEASKNKILKAELMGLRNELAQLKGLTLEHSPENCQCHGIHEYSMRQASLIARGAAPQYGGPSVSSPVQDSPLSVDTPASDVPPDGLFSMGNQMSPAMGGMSRRSSSFSMGNRLMQQ